MLVDGDDHLGGIEPEFPGGGVEDALVGLVRHHPVDLRRIVAGGGERFHLARRRD